MRHNQALAIVCLLAAAGTASAQLPCYAEFDDNVFADNVSMGGPIVAIRFVAPASFSATSIDVFTGEAAGQNSVHIWSHDNALAQPASILGSGSWNMTSTNGWQGAVLGTPVALTAGTTYWLGWTPVGGAQASVDTSIPGNGQSYRASFDGGLSWIGPFQDNHHWKFRVYGGCNPPIVYCTAKVNSLGCLPHIYPVGVPSTTALFGFEVRAANVRNQKVGILLYSVTGRAATPFSGGFLCVAAPVRRTPPSNSGGTPLPASDCSGEYSMDMNSFAQGTFGGNPSPSLLVPGTTVDCQWWGRDPGLPPPNNTTLSDGLEYVLP